MNSMTYFKNFIVTAVFISTLFAGQALESAKFILKTKIGIKQQKN
jgi:hypothetical protein